MIPTDKIFVADYRGTCALCYDVVLPGHKLVKVTVEFCGEKYQRNVHAGCQQSLIDNSPPADAKLEIEGILDPILPI